MTDSAGPSGSAFVVSGAIAIQLVLVSYRTLFTLIATAVAWAVLMQHPDHIVGPAIVALGVIHLVYPFFAASRTVPLLVAGLDGVALYYAFVTEPWGEVTIIIVPILAVAVILALAYAASVVVLLHRRSAPDKDDKAK